MAAEISLATITINHSSPSSECEFVSQARGFIFAHDSLFAYNSKGVLVDRQR